MTWLYTESHTCMFYKVLCNCIGNSTRKHILDEALLNMIVKDMQPTSIVEDAGFKKLVAALDPRFALPSRRTLTRSLLPEYYGSVKGILAQ